jgi:hypothetical protein
VRKADNLPPSCADVKKSGGLNLLEPCGPVRACNGTALPFYAECSYFAGFSRSVTISLRNVAQDVTLLTCCGEGPVRTSPGTRYLLK